MEDQYKEAISNGRDFLKSNWERIFNHQSDQSKELPMPPFEKTYEKYIKKIDLIKPDEFALEPIELFEAIQNRESRRQFTSTLLTLEELSFLLYATEGVKEVEEFWTRRTVPSGGARHCIETYLYIERVEGLENGLYYYAPVSYCLYLIDTNPDIPDKLTEALFHQYWHPAITFIWTVIPYRMEWRYSVVAHKTMILEAGHVCQNLYLAAEKIQCGTCAIAAYKQDAMDNILKLDTDEELTIYVAPLGKIE